MGCQETIKIGIHKIVNLFLVAAVFALIIISIIQYNTWPIYTASNTIPQHQAEFSAVTFCALTGGYKAQVLQRNGIASIKKYNHKTNLNWSSNDSSVTQQHLFLEATYNLDEIAKKIQIRFIRSDENGTFQKVLDLFNSQKWITEQRHRKFGRCYTMYPDDLTRSLGIYYIKFQFHIDVKVYVHARDQFLDLSGRMGYKLYVGERFESQVTIQEISQLEYKHVSNALAISLNDRSCSHEVYDDCMYKVLARAMKENSHDRCTVPWILDNEKICTNARDINTTFWIGWNRITNQEKDCLAPCHTTTVNIGAKNYMKRDSQRYSEMYLYFPSRVTRSEEHYLYTFLKLIGQIGGYLGLYRLSVWILDLLKFNTLVKNGKTDSNTGAEGAAYQEGISNAKDAMEMLDAL